MSRLEGFPITTEARCGNQVDTPLNPQTFSLPNVGDKLTLDYTHLSNNFNTTVCKFSVAGTIIPVSDSVDNLKFDSDRCAATLVIERIHANTLSAQLDWKATGIAESNTERYSGKGQAVEIACCGAFEAVAIGQGIDGDLVQTNQDANYEPAP